MSNPKHIELLKQGKATWNDWRLANPKVRPDLNRANLKGVNLCGYNFSHAKMRWANLRDSDMQMANLSSADLTHANLDNANLSKADLNNAILSEVDLRNTNLTDAVMDKMLFNRINMFSKKQLEDN